MIFIIGTSHSGEFRCFVGENDYSEGYCLNYPIKRISSHSLHSGNKPWHQFINETFSNFTVYTDIKPTDNLVTLFPELFI